MGDWVLDEEELKVEVVNFYVKLYGEHLGPMRELPPNAFLHLTDLDISFLSNPISNEEIKSTLFDMATLKAPGSARYHALFYQIQWEHEACRCIRLQFG
ncbi:hypothetical protein PVK06_024436 [Gossypium arboreum]|uniref:Uncharacterized protein n=1 Tax=Gossypium arboreum TaxID=29729 RepID=A0ABR0PDY4_GOSAR|nr:hypothetical protein PVK06_024436 [Gossypium arboreum]